MRLLECQLKNFGSYRDLSFDFQNLGLSLISGPTKAGKSSLMDGPCWILFGTTSKDSNADDVRSWFADGEVTVGMQRVELDSGKIEVIRVRGSASQNDLYWIDEVGVEHRGKNLAETQTLLEQKLGVSSELYVIGAYLHQFSQVDSFFISRAKDRRELLEKVADLSFAVSVSESSSEARKAKKKELELVERTLSNLNGQLKQSEITIHNAERNRDSWEIKRAERLKEAEAKAEAFEQDNQKEIMRILGELERLDKQIIDPAAIDQKREQLKTQINSLMQAKIEHQKAKDEIFKLDMQISTLEGELARLHKLTDQCPTCLGPANNPNREDRINTIECDLDDLRGYQADASRHLASLTEALSIEKKIHESYDKCRDEKALNDRLIASFNDLQSKAIGLKSAKNVYVERAAEIASEANPHEDTVEKMRTMLVDLNKQLSKTQADLEKIQHTIASLNWLYDASFDLRAAQLEAVKAELQDSTNALLEKYFDAELRILLDFSDQDKLDIEITNEGYSCPYKQLSGGERSMLRLCFWLSLRTLVENNAGVKFSTLMLDEALNGLDPSLKSKAFNLMQALEVDYETIIVIDHDAELKQLFSTQFIVTKEGAVSGIRRLESQ